MMGPKAVPKPPTESVSDALSLLVVMGSDNKAAQKVLKEMKVAQEHNDKLLADTKTAIAESNKLAKENSVAKAELHRETKSFRIEFDKRDYALAEKEADLKAREGSFDRSMVVRTREQDQRAVEAQAFKVSLAARKADMDSIAASLNTREKLVQQAEDAVKNGVIANNAFRDELNERDARMKAAMG